MAGEQCLGLPAWGPPVSVHVVGTVYLDMIFSPVHSLPVPGTEIRTESLGISPGGVANIAVGLARLGSAVSLSALFSDDVFGCYLWSRLAAEGIDLTRARRVPGWSSPVTVSIADGSERAFITHEVKHPCEEAELVVNPLGADSLFVALGPGTDLQWLSRLSPRPRVYLDVGWDDHGDWSDRLLEQLSLVDTVLPNAVEARNYTGKNDLVAAAQALRDRGPTVIVKAGATGAIGVGSGPAVLTVPGVPVRAVDPTGAGDVFDAGIIYSAALGLELGDQMAFANLCAALSVQYPGGALAAPCWRDITAWWMSCDDSELRVRYAFLEELIPEPSGSPDCHRACASFQLDELGALGPWIAQPTSDVSSNGPLPPAQPVQRPHMRGRAMRSRPHVQPEENLVDRAVRRAPSRVLAVGAHPDDVDGTAGGTLALWAAEGVEITYCVLTDGGAGGSDPTVPRETIPEIRQQEQRAAATQIGAKAVIFLGYPDGRLHLTQSLRRDLARVIRQVRPDRVVCQSPARLWYGPVQADHPDHLVAGEATLYAVYPDSRNLFAYGELAEEGLSPYQVEDVWIANAPVSDVVVDITDVVDVKVSAWQCHRSQISTSPDAVRRKIVDRAAYVGRAHSLGAGRLAEEFQIIVTSESLETRAVSNLGGESL